MVRVHDPCVHVHELFPQTHTQAPHVVPIGSPGAEPFDSEKSSEDPSFLFKILSLYLCRFSLDPQQLTCDMAY